MRNRVYIASPISKGDLYENICQADDAFVRLAKAGFAPFNPALSVYLGGVDRNEDGVIISRACALSGGLTHVDWMAVDLPWVAVSDAVLRLPGESTGADMETAEAARLGIPVYADIDELIANPPSRGDERFHELLRQAGTLHAKKARDYGRGADPLANLRASSAVGIEPWRATWLRAMDKVHRIISYCQNGNLANEGFEDSLADLAAYCYLVTILFREDVAAKPVNATATVVTDPRAGNRVICANGCCRSCDFCNETERLSMLCQKCLFRRDEVQPEISVGG